MAKYAQTRIRATVSTVSPIAAPARLDSAVNRIPRPRPRMNERVTGLQGAQNRGNA
jgi:hypothetical protein